MVFTQGRCAITFALWQRAMTLVQSHLLKVTRFVYSGDVKTSRYVLQATIKSCRELSGQNMTPVLALTGITSFELSKTHTRRMFKAMLLSYLIDSLR